MLVLVALSCIVYFTQDAAKPPNGGTWQGYVLGTISALLVVWLSLLGVRKRRYRSSLGSVAGWTSAHVYLGAGLLVIATLHSAAQLGWNVHSLAYLLMCFVILSGFLGIYAYVALPRKSLQNRDGRSRDDLFDELARLDRQGRLLSARCSGDIAVSATSSIQRTRIGGGVLAQLLRRDQSSLNRMVDGKLELSSNRDQRRVLDLIATRIPAAQRQSEVQALQELLSVMSRRQTVIRRIARDIQLEGLMKIWLYVHIPLTMVLLVTLTVHVVSTFFYW